MATVKDIRTMLRSGKTTIGSWIQLPDASAAEIMGSAGYDWIAVDLEHGCISPSSLPGIFRSLELGGTLPLARLARVSAKDIKEALEAGAQGLIFPMIEDGTQLRRAVSWSLYPPRGQRGVGYSRANLFGKEFDSYMENTAPDILLIAQIEHIRAVENLDDILTVEGLDAIIIGPYDLSGSMGLTGKFDHPDFLAALKAVHDKAREHNIPMGLHVVHPDKELLAEKVAQGYQFLAFATDAVFLYTQAQRPHIL